LKLLFDENLSARLVRAFAGEFPDSSHVTSLGLAGTSDHVIWEYARTHGYTVVSKDDDFRSLSLVNGAPPKVIWTGHLVGGQGDRNLSKQREATSH
jgi:predicted nuclease of predicted toxin-antitoxin system